MNSTSLTPITIVVASPNDVLGERNSVTEAAERINTNYLVDQGYILRVFRWEIDSYPGIHPQGPQGIIDDIAKIRNCDVLIGIFWKRLGTPINEGGETGTEHEIDEAYHAWIESGKRKPQLMLYFNNEKVSLKDSKEREQYLKVTQFKEGLPNEIFVWRYENLEEFKTLIYDHLSRAINKLQLTRSEVVYVNTKSNDEYVFFSKWDLNEQLDKFNYTEGIDIDSSGYVYVADEGGYIRKFDSIGTLVAKWGGKGSSDGEFETAYALAIDSSDNIIVTDSAGRIQKFNSDGTFVTKWGLLGKANGQFDAPYGIAIDNFGNIFVSEEGNHRIQKFNATGKFLTKWGEKGVNDGQFNHPIGIAVDSQNHVYVADQLNHRIQVFDNSGKFLLKWGSEGDFDGQFNRPHGITLDTQDTVFVSDSLNNRIQKFSSDGVFLTSWGSSGKNDGELRIPRDLAVDKSGIVYVSDGSNHRIQVFITKNSDAGTKLQALQNKRGEEEEIRQIRLYLDKINSESNPAAEAAWKGIEKLGRYAPIWNYEDLWKAISKEILQREPGSFAIYALDVLKTTLLTSKNKLGRGNEILAKSKLLYQNKLSKIVEDNSNTWQYQKLLSKLILDLIATEEERFNIFWNAWKKCSEIQNENVFSKFTSSFINDLQESRSQLLKSIESEIFSLIESPNELISKRATNLHSLLFG